MLEAYLGLFHGMRKVKTYLIRLFILTTNSYIYIYISEII